MSATNIKVTRQKNLAKQQTALFILIALCLITATGLTVASKLHLCTKACAEGHTYRLFGFTFETVGLISFPLMLLMHLLSRKVRLFGTFTGWAICATLGAELLFLYVQKYKIGSWCPICVSIATTIAAAGALSFYSSYIYLQEAIEQGHKEKIMNTISKGIAGVIFFAMGFCFAFIGTEKYNPLQAAEHNIKDQIAFGNTSSPIEVYIFTDWQCPACRALEPLFESQVPTLTSKARITFVDFPVHESTMNYIPYNLSFMMLEKGKYLALRHDLTKLSEDTDEPTDEQVEALALKHGVRYKQLNYADVATGNRYFQKLIKRMDVEGTPTLVVMNKNSNKAKKLEGNENITAENINKAIETLSKQE